MSDKSQFTAGVAQIVHDTKLFDEDGQLSKDYCLNVVVSTKDLVNRLRDSFETDPRLEQIAQGIVEAMMEDEDCTFTVGDVFSILTYALAVKLPMELGASKETADALIGSAVFIIGSADVCMEHAKE